MKIVSLNIERHKHFDLVTSFLAREDAEVACLMEACESDVDTLAGSSYPYKIFAPNDVTFEKEGHGKTGVLVLAKKPIEASEIFYCHEDDRAYLDKPGMGTHAPALILAKIGDYQIGAVHFTWTENASIDERQRKHVAILLEYLSTKGELMLCGDFNIPRGNEMYRKLASVYHDNIPSEVETTLDPKLHRANFEVAGRLKYIVDYVWTTPKYRVSNLKVESGVSDHCGLVFELG